MVSPQDHAKVVSTYQEARRLVDKANADPAKVGLNYAREMMRRAKKLMRDYGVTESEARAR
jgi:hypothetical protein